MNPPLKIIRASAGSGKTFSLTAHYLVLLFSGPGKYREILAVTFTNKATAEMKDRILGALKELANPEVAEPKFRFIIREHYPHLADQEIRQQAAAIYGAILHDFSRFSISTIDGFVQQVIRSFAFELNLDSGYKLEMNQQKVKDELVKGLNRRLEEDPGLLEWVTSLAIERINDGKDWNYQKALDGLADEIFKERYFPFQEAMRIMDTNRGMEFTALKTLVAAGISSFKGGIIERAARLQQLFSRSGVPADELAQKSRHPILKLNKIIDEEFDLIDKLEPLVSDYALWPNKLLKDTGNVALLYETLQPVLQELVAFYRDGVVQFETYRAIHKNGPYLRLMQEMASLMSEYRSAHRAMLISDAQGLLRGITSSDSDNPSFIWEKTGTRYRHFLFDEFQDTSGFQWENFLPLVKNAIAEQEDGDYPGHLIVGDVKQSIYRWRNGDWRILHSKVKTDLGAHSVSEHNLQFNRRSSEQIIRFNNFLFQTIPGILQEQFNSGFEKGTAGPGGFRENYHDVITRSYHGSVQELTDQTPQGGKIEIDLLAKDNDHEDGNKGMALDLMVGKITFLLAQQQLAMGDICILVRTNTEADEAVRFLLTKQSELSVASGEPFRVISGDALKISANTAVQLLTGTLQLLAAREDENNIFRTYCARLYYGIHHPGETRIDISPAGWLKLAKEPLSRLEGLLPGALCRDHETYLQLPIAELVEKLIEVYGLGEPALNSHLPYLLAFRDQVTAFSSGGDQGIGAFLEWWEAEGNRKSLPDAGNQDAVNVMTIHKSKGLEFNAVLIPFCNWSFNTHSLPVMQKLLWVDAAKSGFDNFVSLPVDYSASLGNTVFAESYFEEMLLNYMDTLNTLYVATTRAKNYLYLISPAKKSKSDYTIFELFSLVFGAQNPFQQEYILENGKLSTGEFTDPPPKIVQPAAGGLVIPSYAVNDPVSGNFATRHIPENTWFNEQQRKGSVLHELLSRVNRADELDYQLNRSIEEGSIRESERETFKRSVEKILSQEQVSHWMRNATRVISEKNILITGGQAERPDKVFVLDNRAILLDFKFGEPRKKDDQQLQRYRELLTGMGTFSGIEAYIWYDQPGILQAV